MPSLQAELMDYEGPIRFGDNVRVRDTEDTRALGFAGLTGRVFGETTPSVSKVEVIGTPRKDFALNVHLSERDQAFWFAADLLEFIDHAPGTEIRIGKSKLVREHGGGWRPAPTGASAEDEQKSATKKKSWWRFW